MPAGAERSGDELLWHRTSILYFAVGDIRAAHAQLTARGVTFRSEPVLVARMPDHELWMAFFDDSEGNTFALACEVRSPA